MRSLFAQFLGDQVVAAISTRQDGSMRVFSDARNLPTRKRREDFVVSLGLDPKGLIGPQLSHGADVEVVTRESVGAALFCDGLVTNDPKATLSVTVADCLPVFFFDPVKKVIALSHAGWRGLSRGIIGETVKKMEVTYGSNPKDIFAGIGPSIGVCHFEVQEDIFPHFDKYIGPALIERAGKKFLDLKLIAREEFALAGILPGHIETSPECTACETLKYFSYRRDKPETIETMMAVIAFC